MQPNNKAGKAIVALMGPTGTGKSSFINLLTKDDNIRVGHDLDSQTVDITTSRYMQDGISVTLVDTPGFDDSHEGITDTDILGKITDFLQEKGGRQLNGIIYLHRISDPRMGGTTKKNIRVFREICGDERLDHVRIVTTNWNLVDMIQGTSRERDLILGAFEPLIKEGAISFRHDRGLKSAQKIMSQLIHQEPVTLKIQEELNAGRTLGNTSAGALIVEEILELKKKHDKEVEGLKKELENASMANNEELRLELSEERRKLEEMMTRVEEDRKTLTMTRVPRRTLPSSGTRPQRQGNNRVDVRARTRKAIVALMGPTGTGKSSFINLLTKDDNIRIGHDLDSQTVNITTSRYMQDGISVTLVDTPGFDDSREGITDTDILGKIADFLQEKGGRQLNGIIYLHRISDPRMGGTTKKNLRIFREICGDERLGHVRIVTTNWNFVDMIQGTSRERDLVLGAFEPLIMEGAISCRHDRGLKSAQKIMSQLIHQEPITLKIQEELNAGRTLGDTSAGALIVEEMMEHKKKRDKEVEGLKKELENASMANNEELRLELAEERRKLELMMTRVEEDRKTLTKTRVPRRTLSRSNNRPRRQGNNSVDGELHLQQVVSDMIEVIKDCSKAGRELLGGFGAVAGGFVGLWFSPFIAAKRAMDRQ